MNRKSGFSFNIAYCGIICALSTIIMFAAVIPSMTYALPAMAGILVWSVRSQINRKWAVLTYAATCALSLFLVPEMEAKIFFILIFGHYPLIREFIQKTRFRLSRFALKLLVFNIAAVTGYMAVVHIFGVSNVLEGLEDFGAYAIYVFWGMGNVAFLFYDFALGYIMYAYERWLKRFFNQKIQR